MSNPTLKRSSVTINYTASDGYRSSVNYSNRGLMGKKPPSEMPLPRAVPGEGWTDAEADAARLALELECLLTDKDVPMATISRWWASAHEALQLHRDRLAAAAPPAPAGTPSDPVEMSPEFTDTARAALLWLLWHHQGGSSPVGQPLRFALGMGAHDRLNGHQIAEAKRWAELSKSTTAEFHNAVHAAGTPSDPWRSAVEDMLSVQHEVASDDPRESINRLINWNVAVALDPDVSSDAQALIDHGKALAGTPSEEATCDWWQDGDGGDAWDTGCRERFVLNEGTPSENNMCHCCYCGKVLVEHIHVDDDQERQEAMSEQSAYRCIAPICADLGCADCNCAIPADVYAALGRAFCLAEREEIACMFDVPPHLHGEAEGWSRAAAADIRAGGSSWTPVAIQGTPSEDALSAAYEAGWRTAAGWAERDDLIADIGSPAYLAESVARRLETLRTALLWYADEAESLAKHMQHGAHTDAVLASLTVLSLDGGRRARAALAAQEQKHG